MILIVMGAINISAQERSSYVTYLDYQTIDMAATRTEVFMDRCLDIPYDSIPRIVPLDSIISELPHIKIQDGYTVKCIVPGSQGRSYDGSRSFDGLTSFIYARPVEKTQIDSTVLHNYPNVDYDALTDIFDPLTKIAIPEYASKEFIWEAYLVSKMYVDMPMYGHANYQKRILLSTSPWFLDKLKMYEYGPYMKDDHDDPDLNEYKTICVNHIEAVLRNSDCGPRYRSNYMQERITHWYWTAWGGLEARSITVHLSDNSISFTDPSYITIVGYDSEWMF